MCPSEDDTLGLTCSFSNPERCLFIAQDIKSILFVKVGGIWDLKVMVV